MKIGIISDSPNLNTGYAKASVNLARQLIQMGHSVTYCSFQHFGRPVNDVYEGESLKSIFRWLDGVHPDVVVHLHDIWAFSKKYNKDAYGDSLYRKCKELGIKFVIYMPIHSRPQPEDLVRICHEGCDLYLTMSEWGRNTMLLHGLNQSHCDYVYHGVDQTFYHPMDKAKCREHFGFKPDIPLIGSIGMNIDYRKNIPYSILAFKELVKVVPEAELVLWTEPYGYWDLPQWIHNLELDNKVHFSNTNKTWGIEEGEIPKLINCFDVYLNTATAEGFGMPILEALACGVPVVCPNTPILKEIFGGFSGVFFAKALKVLPTQWGTLEYLVDTSEAAGLIRERLKTAVNEQGSLDDFTWQRAAQKLECYLYDMTHYKWASGAITDDNLGPATAHESFLIPEILNKGECFVDIGAHVGHWSIRASRFYDKVVAVEPFPETLQVLMKNIELNEIKNIDVRAVAITNLEPFISLHQFAHHHGGVSIDAGRANDGTNGALLQSLSVPSARLDDFISTVGVKPSCVKIDVEGHELSVLKSGYEMLTKDHPKLIIEVHSDVEPVKEVLRKCAYSQFKEINDSLLPNQTYLIAQ